MIDLNATVADTADLVLLRIPKALVVLTRAQFIEALKRGKAWRRREALAARVPRTVARACDDAHGPGGIAGQQLEEASDG